MKHALLVVFAVALPLLAAAGRASTAELPDPGPCASLSSGELEILTYNVHGLTPLFASGWLRQRENNRRASSLLNDYPLAVVQEDFFFHRELSAQATHPFQSGPTGPVCFRILSEQICLLPGDGLGRFSRFPWSSWCLLTGSPRPRQRGWASVM